MVLEQSSWFLKVYQSFVFFDALACILHTALDMLSLPKRLSYYHTCVYTLTYLCEVMHSWYQTNATITPKIKL